MGSRQSTPINNMVQKGFDENYKFTPIKSVKPVKSGIKKRDMKNGNKTRKRKS